MSNPTPSSYHVAPEPARGRRRVIIAAIAAAVLLTGAGAAYAATRSGSSHHAARPGPAATTPAAVITSDSPDPTCHQFLDAYMPGKPNVLGEEPNVWAGHLLANLIGADGIAMELDGPTQAIFALDLNEACLDPSVFDTSARLIGGSVYRANKQKYTHRP